MAPIDSSSTASRKSASAFVMFILIGARKYGVSGRIQLRMLVKGRDVPDPYYGGPEGFERVDAVRLRAFGFARGSTFPIPSSSTPTIERGHLPMRDATITAAAEKRSIPHGVRAATSASRENVICGTFSRRVWSPLATAACCG